MYSKESFFIDGKSRETDLTNYFDFFKIGWSGAQAYLFAIGGVQYRPGPTMHQEINRHANLNHDQGHCPFSP